MFEYNLIINYFLEICSNIINPTQKHIHASGQEKLYQIDIVLPYCYLF